MGADGRRLVNLIVVLTVSEKSAAVGGVPRGEQPSFWRRRDNLCGDCQIRIGRPNQGTATKLGSSGQPAPCGVRCGANTLGSVRVARGVGVTRDRDRGGRGGRDSNRRVTVV